MTVEAPEWIDDIDPGVFEDAPDYPADGDEVAVREWVDRKLRRIAALQRERAVQRQIVANERARIDQFERDAVGPLDRAIEHHSQAVEQWMLRRLADQPQTRSYRLPAGTVAARKLPDLVEADPDVTLPWLAEHRPEMLRTKVEIDKRALNAAVSAGMEVPGVAVTPGRVSVTVAANGFGDAA